MKLTETALSHHGVAQEVNVYLALLVSKGPNLLMTFVITVLSACLDAAVKIRIAVVNLCFVRSNVRVILTAPQIAARLGIVALRTCVWGEKPLETIVKKTTNANRKPVPRM